MKKALFLVVALAVASVAFAQTPGLSFGTWTSAEASFNSPDFFTIDSTATISYNGRDTGLEANINAVFGWNRKLDYPNPPDVQIQDFAIWYKPFPFLKAKAGRLLESGDAMLKSYVGSYQFSTSMAKQEYGVMGTVYPTRELAISAFTQFTGSGPWDPILNSSFALRFAVPKIANFVASYRLMNRELAVGLDFRMISDLVAKVGFKYDASLNLAGLMFTMGKRFGNLNLGIDLDSKISPGFGFGIDGLAEYTVGKYILGVRASYAQTDLWHELASHWTTPYVASAYTGPAASVFVRREFSTSSVQASLSWDPPNAFMLPLKFIIYF